MDSHSRGPSMVAAAGGTFHHARTIAGPAAVETIRTEHIAEALQYRPRQVDGCVQRGRMLNTRLCCEPAGAEPALMTAGSARILPRCPMPA